MKREDGTYDLPDAAICWAWQNERGDDVRWNPNRQWYGWHTIDGFEIKPQPGRWLPWTPPVFPTRKKCDVRLCLITVFGERLLASWTACDYPFRALRKDGCVYHHYSEVTDIQWLTPEYEDELGATDAQPIAR